METESYNNSKQKKKQNQTTGGYSYLRWLLSHRRQPLLFCRGSLCSVFEIHEGLLHSIHFVSSLPQKPWLTIFEIVCFRYNESNYSGCTEKTEYQQKVSNITGNDTIWQQITSKSCTNNDTGLGIVKKKKKGNAVSTPLLWLSELCEVMIKLEAPINTNGASSLVKVAWDNKIRPKRKTHGSNYEHKTNKSIQGVCVCPEKTSWIFPKVSMCSGAGAHHWKKL